MCLYFDLRGSNLYRACVCVCVFDSAENMNSLPLKPKKLLTTRHLQPAQNSHEYARECSMDLRDFRCFNRINPSVLNTLFMRSRTLQIRTTKMMCAICSLSTHVSKVYFNRKAMWILLVLRLAIFVAGARNFLIIIGSVSYKVSSMENSISRVHLCSFGVVWTVNLWNWIIHRHEVWDMRGFGSANGCIGKTISIDLSPRQIEWKN